MELLPPGFPRVWSHTPKSAPVLLPLLKQYIILSVYISQLYQQGPYCRRGFYHFEGVLKVSQFWGILSFLCFLVSIAYRITLWFRFILQSVFNFLSFRFPVCLCALCPSLCVCVCVLVFYFPVLFPCSPLCVSVLVFPVCHVYQCTFHQSCHVSLSLVLTHVFSPSLVLSRSPVFSLTVSFSTCLVLGFLLVQLGRVFHPVMLDLSAAFVTVDHNILLERLEHATQQIYRKLMVVKA